MHNMTDENSTSTEPTPRKRNKAKNRLYMYRGQLARLKEIHKDNQGEYGTLQVRLHRGIPAEIAIRLVMPNRADWMDIINADNTSGNDRHTVTLERNESAAE
jgi:hypothetical protein